MCSQQAASTGAFVASTVESTASRLRLHAGGRVHRDVVLEDPFADAPVLCVDTTA